MRIFGVRARLTAIYGLVFLAFGLVLLTSTYALTSNAVRSQQISAAVVNSDGFSQPDPDPATESERQAKNAGYLDLLQSGYHEQVLHTMLRQGMLALGALAVGSMAVGWFVASRGLRPLRQIAATAQRVEVSKLSERVALAGPRDELRELADSFDQMLARIDAGLAAQRRFIANASHELRTPLAINRTLVEVAIDSPDAPPELVALGRRLLDVNRRQEQTLGALLDLARAEGPVVDAETVELATLVGGVCASLAPEADQRAVAVHLHASPATVVGNAVLWERLVTNLVVNAIRHNHPGGTVWVSVGAEGLAVANTGPVLDPGEVEGLFEPFRRRVDRLDPAGGTGLGLSIVRAVAQAHAATVHAVARPEGGLHVEVRAAAATRPATRPATQPATRPATRPPTRLAAR